MSKKTKNQDRGGGLLRSARNDGVEMVFVRVIRPIAERAEHGALMPGQVIALADGLAETYIEEHLAIYWTNDKGQVAE